jgi:hypothetical protein
MTTNPQQFVSDNWHKIFVVYIIIISIVSSAYSQSSFSPPFNDTDYALEEVPKVQNQLEVSNIDVFPNPAHGSRFYYIIDQFTHTEVSFQIKEITGNEVYSKTMIIEEDWIYGMQFEPPLNAGTYWVVVSSDETVLSEQLIIL